MFSLTTRPPPLRPRNGSRLCHVFQDQIRVCHALCGSMLSESDTSRTNNWSLSSNLAQKQASPEDTQCHVVYIYCVGSSKHVTPFGLETPLRVESGESNLKPSCNHSVVRTISNVFCQKKTGSDLCNGVNSQWKQRRSTLSWRQDLGLCRSDHQGKGESGGSCNR